MNYRVESDLLGDLHVPAEAYYGVQTQRAVQNFQISGDTLKDFPLLIQALGYVKKAAAHTNYQMGLLKAPMHAAIMQACEEVIGGKWNEQFPVDMMQGGAGTSVNMNANEVIANRTLEILGHARGEYEFCSPNDHINLSQSTNDAYPTAIKIALYLMNVGLGERLGAMIDSFRSKGLAFSDVIKMGRTQLQDAVPMTLGQEFEAFAVTLARELKRLHFAANSLLEVNMGGTAIGTGINAPVGFAQKCAENLAQFTGLDVISSPDLIEATPDTSSFVSYSSALRGLALKLSKICNDLRLLSSGPRAGLIEIKLPAMQPGSSIMPGKVNPVIPEVVNQVCYKVIGNDLAVSFASEAAQLQLNVMEPVMCYSIMESMQMLGRALMTLKKDCVDGITANKEGCLNSVKNSICLVTALNPYIGYKKSTQVAREALETGKSIYHVVLESGCLSKEKLEEVLEPGNMLQPHQVVADAQKQSN